MEIVKLMAFALMALFLYSILKQYNPGYALLLSLAACAIVLIVSVRALQPIFAFSQKLSAYADWGDFSCVYKAVAIALLTQFTQDMCKEAGQTALAGRVEFAGKIAMLGAAMPLFANLADIILELLR